MTITPFRLFFVYVLPILVMGLVLIETIAASVFLLNQPSDLAVFGGVVIVPAAVLALAPAARRLWFPRRRS